MYHDMDGWWMLWGGLMMLLFWGGLAVVAAWVIRSLVNSERESGDDSLAIARRRYASGEITREQFEQLRDDLSRGSGGIARTGSERH